jgi:hypothetical protein
MQQLAKDETRSAERVIALNLRHDKEAKRLAKKYDIEWEDDSYYEFGEYNFTHLVHWVPINLLGSRVMIHSRMGTMHTIGKRRCGLFNSTQSTTQSIPTMISASISRSRHTVKPKPPSGGLRVGGSQRTDEASQLENVMRKNDIGFDEFNAAWNDGLDGYVITFNDGRVAQTQINIETNKLHADYGREYLERYTEYDDELTDDQSDLVDSFVKLINEGEAVSYWGVRK